MTSFVDKLRMNSIYPGEGQNPNPFGPPSNMGQGINLDEISNLMGRISPYITEENQKNRDFQMNMFKMQNPQLQNIGNQMAAQRLGMRGSMMPQSQQQQPMNYVTNMPDQMSDYQKGMLDLGKQELIQKTKQQAGALTQKGDIDQQKVDVSKSRSDISQQRANVYEFKARNPNIKFIVPPGSGKVIAVNPTTGERIREFDTGALTKEEELQITGEQDIKEIEARTRGQKEIQGIRGNQALDQIGKRIQGQQDIQANKLVKEELPTQSRVRQQNAARELVNTRPDLAPFIKYNPDGSFEVTPPGNNWFGSPTGPNPQQLQEINDFIFKAPISKSNKSLEQQNLEDENDMREKQFELPKNSKKPESKTEPKKPASKYKVTVE